MTVVRAADRASIASFATAHTDSGNWRAGQADESVNVLDYNSKAAEDLSSSRRAGLEHIVSALIQNSGLNNLPSR